MAVVHDFICNNQHLFQRSVTGGDIYGKRCPLCRRKAEVIYLPRRYSHTPNTVYYENAQGKRIYPWDSRTLPQEFTSAGFVRREVSAFERSRFERRVRQEMNAEVSQRCEQEREEYETERAERHAELRHQSRSFDDFHRAIAEEAMAQEDAGYSQVYDSEFHIGLD